MTIGQPITYLLIWQNKMLHVSSIKSGGAALPALIHKDKS